MAKACVVVDTNVLMVAEGLHEAASDACRSTCIDLVERLDKALVAAVDSGDEIVNEYLGSLRGARGSGLGVKAAVRLYRRRHDPRACRQVAVTPVQDPPGSYEEVPENLRDFDTDDQKFVAVAAAEGSRPQIYTAVDPEWWDRKDDFVDARIDVQFLCPGHFLERECAG